MSLFNPVIRMIIGRRPLALKLPFYLLENREGIIKAKLLSHLESRSSLQSTIFPRLLLFKRVRRMFLLVLKVSLSLFLVWLVYESLLGLRMFLMACLLL